MTITVKRGTLFYSYDLQNPDWDQGVGGLQWNDEVRATDGRFLEAWTYDDLRPFVRITCIVWRGCDLVYDTHVGSEIESLTRYDSIRTSEGEYCAATTFPPLAHLLPAEIVPLPLVRQPSASVGKIVTTVLVATAAAVVSIGAYKALQAATDREWSTRHFPDSYRRERIDAHVAEHGWSCLKCGYTVAVGYLSLDHIVPWEHGGRTSVENSEVICISCNSAKRDRYGIVDAIRGRGGRS